MNKVKRLGFRTAFITAFLDGEPVPVSRARSLEKQAGPVTLYNIGIVPYDDSLPDITVQAIVQLCGEKDIARSVKDGRTVYMVGTFDSKELVDKVMVAVRATGVADVYSVRINSGDK